MHIIRRRPLALAVLALVAVAAAWLFAGGPASDKAEAGTADFNGVYTVLATVTPQDTFYCLSRVDHNTTTEAISSTLVCYADTPNTANPYVRFLNRQDGVAGPTPPPPYGGGELATQTGSWSGSVTDTINIEGCFNNVEGTIGPAVYTVASFSQASLADPPPGTVDIYLNQNAANCKAGTHTGAALTVPVTLDELPAGTDSDGDGCTNFQELDPNPATRLGRDPYNPMDCDDVYSSSYHITATVLRQSADGGTPATITPGLYFNCVADVQVTNDGNTGVDRPTTVRAFCYPDSPGINVNNHVAGSVGDGRGGPSPPGANPGGVADFAEVHAAHASGSGTIAAASDTLTVDLCFDNPHSQLGRVYARAIIDFEPFPTGTADVWAARPDCADPGAAVPTYNDVPLTLSEQGKNYDTDQDNCTDKQELGGAAAQGGLRDPFNWGDFMSVHTGPSNNLQKDKVVSTGDISAIVARFGSNDSGGTTSINRNTNPKTTPPPAPAYHPSYDRGGPAPNGGGGGVPRQLPANSGIGAGAISTGDISAAVSQFGHSCL